MADNAGEQSAGVLVFIHIPKTGGTTLTRRVLSLNEPEGRISSLGNVFKGGGGTSRGLSEQLRNGAGPELGGMRLLTGHVPLGIRDRLPDRFPRDPGLRYFTFLRDPVDRTVSHYFQIHALPDGAYELPALPPDTTLDDALDGGYLHDNLQTRMLCDDPEPFGEVTDSMLDQAKRNLTEGLAFFGLTERFDESLVIAKRRLGLRTILYDLDDHASRVNATRPRGADVPGPLRRAAERCNRFDIELYDHARELFDAAPERESLEFAVELEALRAARGDAERETLPPRGFSGSEEEWRMLLEARAALLRFERDAAARRVRQRALAAGAAPDGDDPEQLMAVQLRAKELERQVRRLETSRERARTLNAERAEALRSRVTELERELKQLKAKSSDRARRSSKRGAEKPAPAAPKASPSRPKRVAKRDDAGAATARPPRVRKKSAAAAAPAAKRAERPARAGRKSGRDG